MEMLFQLGLGLVMICAVVFVIGIVILIATKGQSKTALRFVLISSITAFTIVAIGFGTCVYAMTR